MKISDYRKALIAGFWEYQKEQFSDWQTYFERPFSPDDRPPVFEKHTANHNVLMEPDISPDKQKDLLNEIPESARHRWFRSMRSSQALAQSIFGNLKISDCLHYMGELLDESGEPLFGKAEVTSENFSMEYVVDFLDEPRPTNVDGFISGDYQVAIECKFAETEVGTCSRPRLKKRDPNYCDGTYTRQRDRGERCSLTEIDVRYWRYVPVLFTWRNDTDLMPCPLYSNYQLVRNLLAACIRPDGTRSPETGHMVLIYDERNPAFQMGGRGFTAYEETRAALKVPSLIRKCSWQRITGHLRNKARLEWLCEQLAQKYGL